MKIGNLVKFDYINGSIVPGIKHTGIVLRVGGAWFTLGIPKKIGFNVDDYGIRNVSSILQFSGWCCYIKDFEKK